MHVPINRQCEPCSYFGIEREASTWLGADLTPVCDWHEENLWTRRPPTIVVKNAVNEDSLQQPLYKWQDESTWRDLLFAPSIMHDGMRIIDLLFMLVFMVCCILFMSHVWDSEWMMLVFFAGTFGVIHASRRIFR